MAKDSNLELSRDERRRTEAHATNRRSKWLKRREIWLVVLGVILHAVYMLSIFDIYFKSPIVHGMDLVTPRFKAPAKRLVLLVADGLRADKFYEPEADGNYRAPFLRSIIKERGRWGVSHARPPTESRPGHVAIIAGFYEDPSAVTKGWKANPVEFDSVFNRSRHTISFGSPDIVPIFCSALPHSTWKSYPHEFEDFATDASFLDEWSFDQFQNLVNKSANDPKLKMLLQQDRLVIFLHLLGCDSNGHAHRPFSSIYLNNVKVVDRIAEKMYNLLEDYFKDNQTAYIFTADHGMSDKGSHGDGHPSNTDTPLVAWGAGIRYPRQGASSNHRDGLRFVDEHLHDTPTPKDWGLDDIERVDVNQADIAPLMSTLLGLPCPVNSVGTLPLDYINFAEAEAVEAVAANTKQILNQFIRKSKIKQSNSLHFRPFEPLANYSTILYEIDELISSKDFKAARKLSENLRELAQEGLNYFQTYDWFMLMTVVTLGYIGWMVHLILHVLQSYTSYKNSIASERLGNKITESGRSMVYACGCLLMVASSTILFLEHSPPLYHVYISMTIFLWTRIFGDYLFIREIWMDLCRQDYTIVVKILGTCVVSIVVLEFLVNSFTERRLYTWCFLIFGVLASSYLYHLNKRGYLVAIYVWIACSFLSIFTLMPAEIPDNTSLVVASGAMTILVGVAARWLDFHHESDRFWNHIINHDTQARIPMLFQLQVFLVGIASGMVWLTTSHRTEKRELRPLHQLVNWSVAGVSLILPLFSPKGLLSRLTSIFLGFAPTFLLLSIGYESAFYSSLGLVLMAWILFENSVFKTSKPTVLSASIKAPGHKSNLDLEWRHLELFDVRVPLVFLVLFNVAFFGTGNFASIASFEISSVYRFITVFSPFLMAAMLIFKLFIPFMLVICAFSAITKLIKLPRLGCYFLVILLSDVMTIHFFFLVKTTGSWMEIGNSISHFGIVSAQVVFVLLLFALTNIFTKGIQIRSDHSLSRKAV